MGNAFFLIAAALLLVPAAALAQGSTSPGISPDRLSGGDVGSAITGGFATGIFPGLTHIEDVASVSLPASLVPLGRGRRTGPARGSMGSLALRGSGSPMIGQPGTPIEVVKRARDAITAAALPYGVVRVDAAGAGPMERIEGGYTARIRFRVVYSRQGGLETRQSTISVRLNEARQVVEALDRGAGRRRTVAQRSSQLR